MLRVVTAGESHGPELIAVLDGLPAGVPVDIEAIRSDLARRRLGYGRGSRMSFEEDAVTVSAGVRHGVSIGSPIAVRVANTEWPKWSEVMSAEPTVLTERSRGRGAPLTRPRPGHADLVGIQKYGFDDARPVLERASARETAARVALGTIAKAFLAGLGVTTLSHTVAVGEAEVPADAASPQPSDLSRIDADPMRCQHAEASARMVAEVDAARREGDTLGGIVEVLAFGLPPGLGSHVQWDRRLDGRLAQALMSIQAIKGVEVGDGFASARRRGSRAHDELIPTPAGIARATGRAGGTEGGMSTGEVLRVRAAMKPIATVPHALRTVDVRSGETATAHHQRSDVCAVPAAGVVAEAMVAVILADAMLEKFGGDSLPETARNLRGYLDAIPATARSSSSEPGP